MRRVYRNIHLALITALLLVAVAFEATADGHLSRSALPVAAVTDQGFH